MAACRLLALGTRGREARLAPPSFSPRHHGVGEDNARTGGYTMSGEIKRLQADCDSQPRSKLLLVGQGDLATALTLLAQADEVMNRLLDPRTGHLYSYGHVTALNNWRKQYKTAREG